MATWYERLMPKSRIRDISWLRSLVSGSFFKLSDIRANTSLSDIQTQIDTMRALARDSQISTALAYYATDATIPNSDGRIIWAVPVDEASKEVADVVNQCFDRWNVNGYARDHILELATIGNLYIPTTYMYKSHVGDSRAYGVALDHNTIKDDEYDIVPSTMVPPEDVVHLYYKGKPEGYILSPDEDKAVYERFPENSIIHFSLGGLLGKYTIDITDGDGQQNTYDIKFAQPMLEQAVTPTQTLSLLEDAILLSSLARVVRFIGVECGNMEEEEQRAALFQIKDTLEQQLSLNTANGDVQSFVNPQSPNNLIYLPMINGEMPIQIQDMNMAETNDTDSKLLEHYQDKKLSVLGVPKEMLNFSATEGLGGAGSVLSQRSAIYANALQRIETAYIAGWTDAINKYFESKNYSGFIGKFKLQMQPIITEMSSVVSERRDAAVNQAIQLIEMMKGLGVTDADPFIKTLGEVFKDVLPVTGADIASWNIDVTPSDDDMGGGPF